MDWPTRMTLGNKDISTRPKVKQTQVFIGWNSIFSYITVNLLLTLWSEAVCTEPGWLIQRLVPASELHCLCNVEWILPTVPRSTSVVQSMDTAVNSRGPNKLCYLCAMDPLMFTARSFASSSIWRKNRWGFFTVQTKLSSQATTMNWSYVMRYWWIECSI